MTLFLLLPQDLKREASRYLHKKYYDVVLDELLLFTERLHYCLNERHYLRPKGCIKICARVAQGFLINENVLVARWDILPVHQVISNGKSIQRIKSELK